MQPLAAVCAAPGDLSIAIDDGATELVNEFCTYVHGEAGSSSTATAFAAQCENVPTKETSPCTSDDDAADSGGLVQSVTKDLNHTFHDNPNSDSQEGLQALPPLLSPSPNTGELADVQHSEAGRVEAATHAQNNCDETEDPKDMPHSNDSKTATETAAMENAAETGEGIATCVAETYAEPKSNAPETSEKRAKVNTGATETADGAKGSENSEHAHNDQHGQRISAQDLWNLMDEESDAPEALSKDDFSDASNSSPPHKKEKRERKKERTNHKKTKNFRQQLRGRLAR